LGARFRAAVREETGWAYLVVFVAGGEPEENLAESPMETWAPGVGRRRPRSHRHERERKRGEEKAGVKEIYACVSIGQFGGGRVEGREEE